MEKASRVVAIIPARGGSKGIPRKNLMPFCGRPLVTWTVEIARYSASIRDVYVTSDDIDILITAGQCGAIPLPRPPVLATDTATTESAVLHAINFIEGLSDISISAVVLLSPTSPLRFPHDINESVHRVLDGQCDSLFSMSILDDYCIWRDGKDGLESVTFDYKNRGRRQDRPPTYLENGSIFIFKPWVLRKYNNRLGGKIAMYEMPFWQSYEIDKPEDVEVCEYYMRKNILKEG